LERLSLAHATRRHRHADEVVLELAVLLRRDGFTDTAESLEGAVAANLPDVALTILEREAIVWVLDDPPAGELAALRGLLLEEHVWRVREGLG
jgi:hypothetical protein